MFLNKIFYLVRGTLYTTKQICTVIFKGLSVEILSLLSKINTLLSYFRYTNKAAMK